LVEGKPLIGKISIIIVDRSQQWSRAAEVFVLYEGALAAV
jgi:hypothetical protein